MLGDGFYVINDGYQYKSIKNTNCNWDKCDLCCFSLNNQCNANKDIKKVCNVLENNYWILITSELENKNDNFVFSTLYKDNFLISINGFNYKNNIHF